MFIKLKFVIFVFNEIDIFLPDLNFWQDNHALFLHIIASLLYTVKTPPSVSGVRRCQWHFEIV